MPGFVLSFTPRLSSSLLHKEVGRVVEPVVIENIFGVMESFTAISLSSLPLRHLVPSYPLYFVNTRVSPYSKIRYTLLPGSFLGSSPYHARSNQVAYRVMIHAY